MHVVTVTFVTREEYKDEFRHAVMQQADKSLTRESGCHCFEVSRESSSSNRFFLYELYENKAAFDLHLQSDHYHDFDARAKDWMVSKEAQARARLEP